MNRRTLWSAILVVFVIGTQGCGVNRQRHEEVQERVRELESTVSALEREKVSLEADLKSLRETPAGHWAALTGLRDRAEWASVAAAADEHLGRWASSAHASDVKRLRSVARQHVATELLQRAQDQMVRADFAAEETLAKILTEYADTNVAPKAKSELAQLQQKLAQARTAAAREEEERVAHRERANAKLELRSFNWSQGHGYATVEGIVTNLSSGPLVSVQAIAIFNDGSGHFITSDTALIEYQPLLPGQSSPFNVMARWNPEMKTCRVEFKTFAGSKLPTYHSWRRSRR